MKLFFLYTVPADNSIYKKIKDQIITFQKLKDNGVIDDFACVNSSATENYVYRISTDNKHGVQFFNRIGHLYALSNVVLSYPKLYKYVYRYIKENTFTHIYIRRAVCDRFLISFMKKLNKAGIKILFEIPTYPYDKEFPPNSMYKKIDNKWRSKLSPLVQYIVTPFRGYDYIFDIPVITVDNGIIVDNVKRVIGNKENTDNTINLIAVAGLSYWHGYDRLIKGLIDYYDHQENPRELYFHLVGGEMDNQFRKEYEQLVLGSSIESRVKFYGPVFGEELNKIYEIADIAVSSLGLHRLGLKQSATLKSREYLAKGLPIISEGNVGYDSEDFKYALNVPMDESPINIQDIIDFYDRIYNNGLMNREDIISDIVNYAYKNFDMYELMKNMIKELKH